MGIGRGAVVLFGALAACAACGSSSGGEDDGASAGIGGNDLLFVDAGRQGSLRAPGSTNDTEKYALP